MGQLYVPQSSTLLNGKTLSHRESARGRAASGKAAVEGRLYGWCGSTCRESAEVSRQANEASMIDKTAMHGMADSSSLRG